MQSEVLEYLEWFWKNCDFGPAHEDVVELMEEQYTLETGKVVPAEYSCIGEE